MKRNLIHSGYIWQRADWPDFRWDSDEIMEPLNRLNLLHGKLSGQMAALGFEKQNESLLTAMTDELTYSSEIEGIALNPQSVRSSIARKLGIEDNGMLSDDHYIEGLVEVMLDATHNCDAAITEERLFGWHAALFPMGRSGMYKINVGQWRSGDEPMQVVSGAWGHERVHYEAVPSASVAAEMDKLIKWCNTSELSPFIKAAVAHLWFVSIHPFDDGNGRISRTLADMFLARVDTKSRRYYSMSAEINRNKHRYYDILEQTQKSDLDITDWLLWFFDTLEQSLLNAMSSIESTLRKAEYWAKYNNIEINERQRKVINRLWDGFDGKLTTSKWAKMCKCSQDTALRDITALLNHGMLCRGSEGGRSINYMLPDS